MTKKNIPFRPLFSDKGKSKYGVIMQKPVKVPSFLKIGCQNISALHVPVKHLEQDNTGLNESSETQAIHNHHLNIYFIA